MILNLIYTYIGYVKPTKCGSPYLGYDMLYVPKVRSCGIRYTKIKMNKQDTQDMMVATWRKNIQKLGLLALLGYTQRCLCVCMCACVCGNGEMGKWDIKRCTFSSHTSTSTRSKDAIEVSWGFLWERFKISSYLSRLAFCGWLPWWMGSVEMNRR